MSYVDQVIQPGETVVHRAVLHWALYVPGLLLVVLGLVVIGVAYGMPAPVSESSAEALRLGLTGAGLLAVAIGALTLLKAFIRRWTTEIAVTSKRVIYKTGLVRRLTSEISIDKIETVLVDQSVIGRILNFGTVIVRGTGGGLEPVHNIAEPLEFRSKLTAR
jgi:uncharacterized membrane protein YdbT with pleckstrin-like domain